MSYIQVDSRGCGAGKTVNTIIPQIQYNIRNFTRTLLVVPSINLQNEYAKYFRPGEFAIINSEYLGQSVSEQYSMANAPVVCITHEAFLRNDHRDRDNVQLIIDEAFDPFGEIKFNTHNEKGIAVVDLSQVLSWKFPEDVPNEKPTVKPQPMFELDVDKSRSSDLLNNKWTQLQSPNLRVWSTWETFNSIQNKEPETVSLYLEYDALHLLEGWSSVWIAAAVFEKTFMSAWIDDAGLDYEVVFEFVPHKSHVEFHIPAGDFSWSSGYRKGNVDVENAFRDYINATRQGKLFYNTNNDSTLRFIRAERITHNAHGLNSYSDYLDYAFVSSIKPSASFRSFLIQRCGYNDDALEFAFAGYTAYQLLMRSALRDPNNTEIVRVYLLDTRMALGILDLFNTKTYEVIHIESIQGNKVVKPKKTRAEIQKEYRARKKANK